MILLLLYPIGVTWIGFTPSTIIFISLILIWGKYRRAWEIALYAVVGTLILLYTFVKLAYVPLPMGMGFIEDINIAIYKLLGIF